MPTEDLLESINNTFFNSEFGIENFEELYLTFYINPRGVKFVSDILNKYGTNMEQRAQSLCDSLKGIFNLDNRSISVFDTYVNGNSPMAVIKISK